MTASTFDYVNRITSEHSPRPRYVQTVTATIQSAVDNLNLLEQIPELFDVDTAVGQQLDVIGQWVGLTRFINTPLNVYFSWGVPHLGWGEGVWRGRYDPNTIATALDDYHYRLLLKARIAANQWDGTIPGAYEAWNTIFEPEGFSILIQDGGPTVEKYFSWGVEGSGWGEAIWVPEHPELYHSNGDMSIILALLVPAHVTIDPITLALFTGGYLDLKPAGVRVKYYMTQSVPGYPLFAWGVDNEHLGGWGRGVWPNIFPPIGTTENVLLIGDDGRYLVTDDGSILLG